MTDSSGRRTFLGHALALPALLTAGGRVGDNPAPAAQIKPGSLKVVCVGAHPDDPESGCGGTLAMYASQGHQVTVVYLTRGERGIQGKSDAEAAAIRTAEAESACRILGARPVFAGQIDGSTELTRASTATMARLLQREAPDLVLA